MSTRCGILSGAAWTTLIMFGAGLVGCSDGAPKKHVVSGLVNLNNQPLPNGSVTFLPASTGTRPEGASIKDGRFKLEAVEGSYKVSISATKPSSDKPSPGAMGPAYLESLPVKYNTETTLTTEVISSGKNQVTFELRSN